MNLFSRLSRPLPSQSRPDGLHLERVDTVQVTLDNSAGRWTPKPDGAIPAPTPWPGARTAMHTPAPDVPLPGNWADSPLATRLQHHLDAVTADRDALALANGRLVARIREQDTTITDLTARLEGGE